MYFIYIIVLLNLVFHGSHCEWQREIWLDADLEHGHDHAVIPNKPKFYLKWKTDEVKEIITFLIEVETQGWAGFGISPNGEIKDSDLVIAWITKNGKTHFHDRLAIDETTYKIDRSQDWSLLDSSQNQTHIIFKFWRYYKTCDDSHDLEILKDNTMRLIYVFGDKTPDLNNETFEYTRKGTRNVLLLSLECEHYKKDEDLEIFDFTVQNVSIPSRSASYWYKLFKLNFSTPRHMIEFAPYITPGNEDLVHHIIVNVCTGDNKDVLDQFLGSEGFEVVDFMSVPKSLFKCMRAYFQWGYGGTSFKTPFDTAFPLSVDEETTYFLLQMHYMNPLGLKDRVDSSGLRTFHTSNLRPNELFILNVGKVLDYGLIVPPYQKDIVVAAHCSTKCFDKFMTSENITLIATLPHYHGLGYRFRTRHFRGNIELPNILDDKNYDYRIMQLSLLRKRVTVLPGDIITTECFYNSSQRNYTTLGGSFAAQEMCAMSLAYYPRIKIFTQFCFSGESESTILQITGLKEIKGYGVVPDPIIQSPEEFKNRSLSEYLYNNKKWINGTKNILRFAKQKLSCYVVKDPNEKEEIEFVSYPNDFTEYIPPETKCHKVD